MTETTKRNLSLKQYKKYFLSIGDYGGAGMWDDIIKNYEFCKGFLNDSSDKGKQAI